MKPWYALLLSTTWIWIAAMWTTVSVADTRICTEADAEAAETVAATAVSWGQLHQQFWRYAHCDDGAIAEGFSESVTVLLAKHWDDLEELGMIVTSDSAFRKFVIRHIDETVAEERLKLIAENADNQCPRYLKKLCLDIRAAVKQRECGTRRHMQ
jgi:hypothetical protein